MKNPNSPHIIGKEEIQELIEKQANDISLWCQPQTVMESILQRELRRLHAMIEGDMEILSLIPPYQEF